MTKKPKASTPEASQERIKHEALVALAPAVNAAAVMKSYQGNITGDVDFMALVEGLCDTFQKVDNADLSTLESMLIGQATALQTIFVSLARRAQVQEYQKNLEAFLSLALKAQAQSRATIQAVAELKYPRQVAFVKQANISHGPQQVNNGQGFETGTRAHAEENQFQQNKLLEDGTNGGTYLDAGTTVATSGSDSTLETVAKIDRTKKRERKGKGFP